MIDKCFLCSKDHTPEYMASMEFQTAHNSWDDIDDVMAVLEKVRAGKWEWSWARNPECKYLDVRIDMRDGGCIIKAKGKRISPRQLQWQYSKETPDPVPDKEAYK